MKVIGFNFNKISIEKLSDNFKNISLESQIDFEEVKNIKSNILNSDEEVIVAKAKYILKYSPDIVNIEMGLNVLISLNPENSKKIIENWNDSKKLPEDFRFFLNNLILKKTTLKALELEDELNIPPHIPMPSLKKQEDKENK